MKKQTLFFLLLSLVQSLFAAHELEQFLRGNKLFQEGKAQEALKEYTEISNKGPVLWYNSALCHLELQEPVKALIAFKRAERFANNTLLTKIEPLIKKVQTELNQPHESDWIQGMRRYASYFSLFWLQVLVLLLWWFAAIGLWCGFFKKTWQRFLLVISLLFCVGSIAVVWWARTSCAAVALNETSFYIGPNVDFHEVGSVTKGQLVTVKKHDGQWYNIKTKTGSGWIVQENLEPIELDV